MIDPDTFAMMLRVAEQFESLAQNAEGRHLATPGLPRKHGSRST
jgi:hypothetical protein